MPIWRCLPNLPLLSHSIAYILCPAYLPDVIPHLPLLACLGALWWVFIATPFGGCWLVLCLPFAISFAFCPTPYHSLPEETPHPTPTALYHRFPPFVAVIDLYATTRQYSGAAVCFFGKPKRRARLRRHMAHGSTWWHQPRTACTNYACHSQCPTFSGLWSSGGQDGPWEEGGVWADFRSPHCRFTNTALPCTHHYHLTALRCRQRACQLLSYRQP